MDQNRVNICFLQYDLRGGGAERKVCTLANFFAQKGYNVEIGLYGSNEIAYKIDPIVKITYIRRSNFEYRNDKEKKIFCMKQCFQQYVLCNCADIWDKVNVFFSNEKLKKINRKSMIQHFNARNNYIEPFQRFIDNRQDYVFITMMHDCFSRVHKLYGSDIPNPYIVMECNNPARNASPERDAERNLYYPTASACVAMTEGIKNYFNEEIQRKFVIIPNPVRSDLPPVYNGKRRKTIVNFCRLNVQKNLPLLIEAFEKFHNEYPDYNLEIYGEGELHDSLIQLIESKHLSSCITINHFDPAVHEKIKDCAMYVSSSNWEGFPNSVLEALSIGLPVISTDCDFGPRDMIIDSQNGLLIPTNDVNSMYLAMKKLADHPELAKKLSDNASLVREKYSVECIGTMWIELINKVLKENS